jgi:hypothetical protein
MTRELGDELLPCPFCGGDVMPRHALFPSDGDTDAIIHVGESECGMVAFDIWTADQGVSVALAWNTRPQAPASGASDLEGRLRAYGFIKDGISFKHPMAIEAADALASARAEIAGLRGACGNCGFLPEKAGQEGATNTDPALTKTSNGGSHG